MSENTTATTIENLHHDWRHLRETAGEQLIQTKELLNKLRAARGINPPNQKEKDVEALAAQLTAICQQIDAQFLVVHQAVEDCNKASYDHQIECLIGKFQGWYAFLRLGTIAQYDFVRMWLQGMGVPTENKDPTAADSFGLLPKHMAACTAWEQALLFPRKISSLLEIGSGFGLSALRLTRMVRMGTIEQNSQPLKLARHLEKLSPAYGRQPSIGFSHCQFQLSTTSTLPIDAFDAIWFHRSIWNQWIKQDGPALVSALSELARRAHFLLLTSSEERLPREDLLTPNYDIQCVGTHQEGAEYFRYFVAQRRFLPLAGKFFQCLDMRLHDPTWQGFETLSYNAAYLPWNTPSLPLSAKRYLLGKGQVARTFLKRLPDQTPRRIHLRETEIWPSLHGLVPELPKMLGHSEDESGYHLLLEINGPQAEFPLLPLKEKAQQTILRSAMRILDALRKKNLNLNFLRLGNFVMNDHFASFLAAEFVGYEELEEPLDALLWLLRDLNADILYWHNFPIEPFRAELVSSLAPEYQTLATLALRSKNIDQFLSDPLVQHQFLNPL